MDIQEKRRQTLRQWIDRQGGHGAVVRRFRLSTSEASYLSALANGYTLGERCAAAARAPANGPTRAPMSAAQTAGNWCARTRTVAPIADAPWHRSCFSCRLTG